MSAAGAILAISGGAYAASPTLDERGAVAASYVVLLVASALALALALAAAHAAVLRCRPWVAGLFVALAVAPLVLNATIGLFGALVLLGAL